MRATDNLVRSDMLERIESNPQSWSQPKPVTLIQRVCSTSALAPVYAPLASLTRAPPTRKRYFVGQR